MKGHRRHKSLLCLIFTTLFTFIKGCQIEGVSNWLIPVSTNVLDIHRGNVLDRTTSSIEAINTVSYAEGLNSGPYLDISYADSRFVISTNAAYANYEENETSQSMAVTVNFRCTGGSFSTLVFLINVIDTNNNAPRFVPSDQFVFTVAPPLPPGFMVTGCLNDITVRDIDLTTQRIEFGIEDNPYFEIAYDAASSTVEKEFKAILRTTTFIRNIPDALSFRITATDIDLTGDPPLTTTATVTINGDTEFQFPEEPVFTQAFYLANYTEDDQLVLNEPISLEHGYHDDVIYTLHGEYSNNFVLVRVGNQVSIRVVNPLSADVLTQNQIILVVRADREYASGHSATVIMQLPEGIPLKFERAHYEGRIEDNTIQVPVLTLTKGYEGRNVSALIYGEYSSYFTAVIQGNTISLSMTPLSEDIINVNSFIYLEIVASTDHSSTKAIVTLEIIKDDTVTPVFNQPIYMGAYNADTGLALEQIILVQGYNETVSVYVEGDYASFFQVIQNGSVIYLTTTTIPPEIFNQNQIVLSMEATKPRTVGANAAIIIALPTARELDFEESTYMGTLQDNVLNLEPIVLNVGYDENVNFVLTGDHATYFSIFHEQNQVTINLTTPILDTIISENNIIILTLSASGLNAITATTSVVLDVIKDDITTPVFARNIYMGTYVGSSVVIEDINLIQGFDDSVTFRLDGDHVQYFQMSITGNNAALSLRSAIPESVMFDEKVLLFNILADKTLTVGANAAVLIRFPSELTDSAVLRFTQNTYTGTIENNILNTDNIVLDTGYATGTEYILTGDYSDHFALTNTNNIVSIASLNPLPSDVIENNKFIVLEIEARRDRATSVWTSLVIDIVKPDLMSPVFTEAYYRGVYSPATGLQFDDEISLLSGYDETVSFTLEGEYANNFLLVQSNSSVSITTIMPLPEAVIENNSYLIFAVVANKPNATTARAAIFIDIDKESQDTVVLRFEQSSYVGMLQDDQLRLPTITLINSVQDVNLAITGDYASYFTTTRNGTGIAVVLVNDLPSQIIEENTLITLELQASYPNTVSGVTAIIIEISKDQTVTPVFEETYYIGEYSVENGLLFENTISLARGFDESVSFALNGDDAKWFTIVENGQNNVTLSVSSSIQTNGRSHLVFSIVASKPGSEPASTAIIISLTDVTISGPLRFLENYYTGSIEGLNLTLDPMILEGHSAEVAVSIIGDYANYFQLTNEDGVYTLQILNELPDEITRNKNFLIFTLEAQIQNTRTQATIIVEIIKPNDEVSLSILQFEETYYTGYYNSSTFFVFDTSIRLTQGYDAEVIFNLEGEHSQWFSLVHLQNSVTLTLSSAIPAAVLANNRQLVFVITAQRPGSINDRATIIISLIDEFTENTPMLGFDRVTYLASIQNNTASLEPITLIGGSSSAITFSLVGVLVPELSSYFTVTTQGYSISVSLQTAIPEQLIPSNRIIILEIRASEPQAVSAYATIVFEVIIEDDFPSSIQLIFDQAYYTGSYNTNTSLVFDTPITLLQGYDTDVQFNLEGEHSQWFSLVQTQNSVTLILSSLIPAAVLANNSQLLLVITAQRTGSTTARAAIVITLTNDFNDGSSIIGFDRVTYIGSLQSSTVSLEPITLIVGYSDAVTFSLVGDFSSYFTLTAQGSIVNISLQSTIPEELIPTNRIIVLEIQATAPQTISAYATIVFEVVIEDDTVIPAQLIFDETYYSGSYNTVSGFLVDIPIALMQGYDDDVQFSLEGEQSQWFSLVQEQNYITLSLSSAIPAAVLANNRHLLFVIAAQKPGAISARATIIISLTEEVIDESLILGFDKVTYIGSLQSNITILEPITLVEGYYDNVTFSLFGELSSYFILTSQGPLVSVVLQTIIPEQLLPSNRIIVLEIQASAPQVISTHATIVFGVVVEDDISSPNQLIFDETYYTGSYNTNTGLLFESPIILIQGYDSHVQFELEGEHSQWFTLEQTQNSVTLTLSSAIPAVVLAANRKLVFVISALRPESIQTRATVIISIAEDSETGSVALFEKVFYEGITQLGNVQHESIRLSGYSGTNVGVYGEYASAFVAYAADGVVTVQMSGSLTLPADVTSIILELHARGARAVLLLNVLLSDVPSLPSVTFSSPTYFINVEIAQTGVVGRVEATADNGETIGYYLLLENAHLLERLSVNNDGEIHLFAPVNSGVYVFQVIATTAITQATANATVHLTVEAITVCGEDEFIVPPLIILDRDEEEPHRNLVVLNNTQYPDCQFTLTNRWPADQTWLYVDENGLHTTAIDREHESIAFMALSQVQVELLLSCGSDNLIRTKRSERTDWLGPYDYGSNKWILADTIPYNSRRSVVNLIVNDINDNAPIFIGKEAEPIAVGYPTNDLEDLILPRSLAELQATDADIGENAALLYWSHESSLAVAPTTGFVHVRSGAELENNQLLMVHATDRNGEGLMGSIQLLVKLLDNNNIVVVTVRDAFLDDEKTILTRLRDAVGYDVRSLRSVVISDDINEEDKTRKKRERNTAGALLQLYVYGLIDKEPIGVDRLKEDINNNVIGLINVISTVSLDDHLEGCEICVIPGRDIGLLVATIVLSVLLFILIMLIALWFFLRWRKDRNYDQFSDENSLASRNDTAAQPPKSEDFPKPRLNIQDLKKSERRLQDMLNAPMDEISKKNERKQQDILKSSIEEISIEPSTSRKAQEPPVESILDLPLPESQGPIVIQSIDKLKDADDATDDEFGEVNGARRKSVVTFNENVEKFIHVEDDPDEVDSSKNPDYEIYKL